MPTVRPSRLLTLLAGAAALAGCASPVPDTVISPAPYGVATGEGVGFGDYEQYAAARARRETDLLGSGAGGLGAVPPLGARDPAAPLDPSILAAVDEVSGVAPAPASIPAPAFPAPAAPLPAGAPAPFPPLAAGVPPPLTALPPVAAAPGISDEQDFAAVSSRETIESDAERLARARASRTVVRPEALPQRPADTGPNIVAYALQAPNAVGEPRYRRGGVFGVNRTARNCAAFTSADRAQEAFLAAGGPQRDRQGLDPDGDGFACGWDPAPFRRAVN